MAEPSALGLEATFDEKTKDTATESAFPFASDRASLELWSREFFQAVADKIGG